MPQQSGTSARLDAVAFADEMRGWAVSPPGGEPAFMTTGDGGAGWRPVEFVNADYEGAILIDVCTVAVLREPAAGRDEE